MKWPFVLLMVAGIAISLFSSEIVSLYFDAKTDEQIKDLAKLVVGGIGITTTLVSVAAHTILGAIEDLMKKK